MSKIKYVDQEVPVQSIDVGDRARIEYEDIDELALDISNNGLMNPLTVVSKERLTDEAKELETNTDLPYLLVAGGRRLEAIKQAKLKTVAVRFPTQGNFSKERLKILELHENIQRMSLTYQEELKLKSDIHKLQTKIAKEENVKGKHSISETSKILGESKSNTARDLELAEAMENMPEVFKDCKNKSEAYKKYNELKKKAAAQVFAERKSKEKPKEDDDQSHKKRELISNYITKDFFEHVKNIEDKSISFVELDPPYAIDLKKIKRESYGYIESYNEVDAEDYEKFMRSTLKECYRILKDKSWIIVWFGHDWFSEVKTWIEEEGFNVRPIPGIWSKGTGQVSQPEMYMASSYEMFFYASKGDAKLYKQGRVNVFNYTPVGHASKIHPTERPIEMMEDILSVFSIEFFNVFVPFVGSGNTLLAAANRGQEAQGCELSEKFKPFYETRIWEGEIGEYKSYNKKDN